MTAFISPIFFAFLGLIQYAFIQGRQGHTHLSYNLGTVWIVRKPAQIVTVNPALRRTTCRERAGNITPVAILGFRRCEF